MWFCFIYDKIGEWYYHKYFLYKKYLELYNFLYKQILFVIENLQIISLELHFEQILDIVYKLCDINSLYTNKNF